MAPSTPRGTRVQARLLSVRAARRGGRVAAARARPSRRSCCAAWRLCSSRRWRGGRVPRRSASRALLRLRLVATGDVRFPPFPCSGRALGCVVAASTKGVTGVGVAVSVRLVVAVPAAAAAAIFVFFRVRKGGRRRHRRSRRRERGAGRGRRGDGGQALAAAVIRAAASEAEGLKRQQPGLEPVERYCRGGSQCRGRRFDERHSLRASGGGELGWTQKLVGETKAPEKCF